MPLPKIIVLERDTVVAIGLGATWASDEPEPDGLYNRSKSAVGITGFEIGRFWARVGLLGWTGESPWEEAMWKL